MNRFSTRETSAATSPGRRLAFSGGRPLPVVLAVVLVLPPGVVVGAHGLHPCAKNPVASWALTEPSGALWRVFGTGKPVTRENSAPAKIYTIFEGTSEIQRLVIARAISGMHIR